MGLTRVNGKHTPEFKSWRAMKYRCQVTKGEHVKWYSGVSVCERWRNSFKAFLDDMGPRPPGTTLDRYPNKAGNYEPGNCRWATPAQQSNNARSNVIIEIGGFIGNIEEWCRALKLNRRTVDTRLHRNWTPYEALFEPVHR